MGYHRNGTEKTGVFRKVRIPDLITGVRIACSVALLFFPVFSAPFYALYILAGLSDMADGAVARKTKTASEFGAQFDTAADFLFVAVCAVKLLPAWNIPVWIWGWTAVIALIKIFNLISGAVMQKKLVSLHTVMNKVTGVLLFVLPLTVSVIELKYSAAVVCAVATFAAVQEGHYIRTK